MATNESEAHGWFCEAVFGNCNAQPAFEKEALYVSSIRYLLSEQVQREIAAKFRVGAGLEAILKQFFPIGA